MVVTYLRGVRLDDDSTSQDGLTVRQMALLAGMEEMTIRTAASRKGPNYMVSTKDGSRTVFERSVAKEWLKAKGRYTPVQRHEPVSATEALNRSYDDVGQFLDMVKSIADTSDDSRAGYFAELNLGGSTI